MTLSTLSAELHLEERNLWIHVTGAPDFTGTPVSELIPEQLEITYRRRSPGADVKVVSIWIHGAPRLKSGRAGTGRKSFRVWGHNDRPQWITDLVTAYMPRDL